ncbi:MAG: 2-isopropylmalate synthase [Candidatus Caldarchaeum sp.]|nr:2-isopropylmalate synthase [Candidatus Caldarchaeum sp.]MDW8435388.1 2-isopropylmalate synthase [Candidatus Caldarchaeum sp.]
MAWRDFLELNLSSRVVVFDTTLRDGEQTAGAALKPDDKVRLAEALADLGVDVVEAGFPPVSAGESSAIKEITAMGLGSKICVLSRCEKSDIDSAAKVNPDWIHVFIATSDIHLQHKLKLSRDQALEKAVSAVEYAKSFGFTVHFSAEDATRTELPFLLKVFKAVEEAGADSIDIPDTVGTAVPPAMKKITAEVVKAVKIPVAVHCHDDFGLAVANSLAGVEAGAEIVHATVNGIGERAGNASLEEIVASLRFLYGVDTSIRLEKIYRVSRLVEKLMGIVVPKNKAIVGDNAFAHESGIHVHGILGNPTTYEPVMPEVFGRRRRIVFGKHSGIHGLEAFLREYGFTVDRDKVSQILWRIKDYADAGGKVSEETVLSFAQDVYGRRSMHRSYVRNLFLMLAGNSFKAQVDLMVAGEPVSGDGEGPSSVEAALNAVSNALKKIAEFRVEDLKIHAPLVGHHSSEAEVVVSSKGVEFVGRGIGADPALAVVAAFTSAAHQIMFDSRRLEAE